MRKLKLNDDAVEIVAKQIAEIPDDSLLEFDDLNDAELITILGMACKFNRANKTDNFDTSEILDAIEKRSDAYVQEMLINEGLAHFE